MDTLCALSSHGFVVGLTFVA